MEVIVIAITFLILEFNKCSTYDEEMSNLIEGKTVNEISIMDLETGRGSLYHWSELRLKETENFERPVYTFFLKTGKYSTDVCLWYKN